MSDRRLREMGIDPDGDPIEIMREVDRRFKAVRAAEEADAPVVVDAVPEQSAKSVVNQPGTQKTG